MVQPTYNEVIERLGTPAYVFDCDEVKRRIQLLREHLGNQVHLCYAMKANPFVIGTITNDIDRYEVCSPGEFKICERANIPMEKVVLSGVYKEKLDTLRIVATYRDSITYTAESLQQFHLLNKAALENNIIIRVLLRLTTGNQFGIDESEVCQLIKERTLYPNINIIGIQHFSGTQRKRISKYTEELAYCDEVLEKLANEYDYVAQELEFGPGFFVEYFQDQKPYDEVSLLDEFKTLLDNLHFKGQITLELGRFIVASCGTYYTQIVDQKHNKDISFCIVDGGIHQMNYFGQMLAMKLPYYRHLSKETSLGESSKHNICGSLCTINDNLVKSLPLTNPKIGDILEFQRVGAYSMSESIGLFLSRDLPKIFLFTKSDGYDIMRDRFETNILNYKNV
ncbi:MAG: alanine racemase [Longicatena sp.]